MRAGRVAACLALIAAAVLPANAAARAPREVLYVGNNWDATADVVHPRSFERIARINIIPVEHDLMQDRITRLAHLPVSEEAAGPHRRGRPPTANTDGHAGG